MSRSFKTIVIFKHSYDARLWSFLVYLISQILKKRCALIHVVLCIASSISLLNFNWFGAINFTFFIFLPYLACQPVSKYVACSMLSLSRLQITHKQQQQQHKVTIYYIPKSKQLSKGKKNFMEKINCSFRD